MKCLLNQLAIASSLTLSVAAARTADPALATALTYQIPHVSLAAFAVSADAGFHINTLGQWAGTEASSAPRVRLGWAEEGLLLSVQVPDTTPNEVPHAADLWAYDSAELFVASAQHPRESVQILIAPGIDPKSPAPQAGLVDKRQAAESFTTQTHVSTHSHSVPGGYQMDSLIPWSDLPAGLGADADAYLQLQVNDAGGGPKRLWCWFPSTFAYRDITAAMNRVHFGKTASDPVNVALAGHYDGSHPVLAISAVENAVGKSVAIYSGDSLLANGTAPGKFTLPVPFLHGWEFPLTVRMADQPAASIYIPPSGGDRMGAIQHLALKFKSNTFTGDAFPQPAFTDPELAEALLGNYSVETDCYDAQFNPVTHPESLGRYGVIMTIHSEDGLTNQRRTTLFRLADPADVPPKPSRDDDERYWATLEEKRGWPGYEFLIHVPSDYERQPQKSWPLILSLHGSGAGGNVLAEVAHQGLARRLATDTAFSDQLPAFVISPRSGPADGGWNPYRLDRLLRELSAKYRIDQSRITVTGFSMGGFGTWDLAAHFPHRFAALVPICGIGNKNDIPRFLDTPVWAFHGDLDQTVPLKPDVDMLNALKAAGGNVRMTIYSGLGHDSWDRAYGESELFAWILEQHRG